MSSKILILLLTLLIPFGVQAAPIVTDLAVESIEFSPLSGNPTAVMVKNVGASEFKGTLRPTVTLLNSNDEPLPSNDGYTQYGDYNFYTYLATGSNLTIPAGQSLRIPSNEPFSFRHRLALKAKASLGLSDSNNANNSKTVTIPPIDLKPNFISITKNPNFNNNTTEIFNLKYSISNLGSAGFIAGSTSYEPEQEIEVKFESGRTTKYATGLFFQLKNSVPAGTTLEQTFPIDISKAENPQSLTIKLDLRNQLAESNESNNSVTVPFTRSNATPTPTPTATSAATPSPAATATTTPLVVSEVSTIKALPLTTTQTIVVEKVLGLTVKPCTISASLKSVRDNLTTALTFDLNKKAANKLKQAADAVQGLSAATNSNDQGCMTKELNNYSAAQSAASTMVKKIETKNQPNADLVALNAVTSNLQQIKTIQVTVQSSSASAQTKNLAQTTADKALDRTVTVIKTVKDEAATVKTVKAALDSQGQATTAAANLAIGSKLAEISSLKEIVAEASTQNKQTLLENKPSDPEELKKLELLTASLKVETSDNTASLSSPSALPSISPSVSPTTKATPTLSPEIKATSKSNKAKELEGENETPKPNITPNTENNDQSSNAEPCPAKAIPDNTC